MTNHLLQNHLLFGRKLNLRADNVKDPVDNDLVTQASPIETIIGHFWKRWRVEYVTELREHQKCKHSSKNADIAVNDTVIIYEDKASRIEWKVGVVEELNRSADDRVKGALVRYVKDGKTIRISGPVNKLYPLEYRIEAINMEEDETCIQFVDDRNVALLFRKF